MRLLYPSSPLQPRQPDELYAEEYAAAVGSGFSVSLFSYEEFTSGNFRARPTISDGDSVLYRGWMVTPAQYRQLRADVSRFGAEMLTSPEHYELCHHLPRWYPTLAEFTPETCFFRESDDVASRLRELSWTDCFLKDYVKSLAIGDGSLVTDLARIPEVIAKMKTYRGEIEGGICARRVEDFDPDTEDRYFVFRGTAHARKGSVPEVVEVAARRIGSPFFTADTVRRRDGVMRIVELGDGQVSDRKQWTAEQLLSILAKKQQTRRCTEWRPRHPNEQFGSQRWAAIGELSVRNEIPAFYLVRRYFFRHHLFAGGWRDGLRPQRFTTPTFWRRSLEADCLAHSCDLASLSRHRLRCSKKSKRRSRGGQETQP